MGTLAVGTKEYVIVRLRDKLGRLTDLAGVSPTFDVKLRDDPPETWILQGSQAQTDGMNALCLVDTDTWEIGTYELYLEFTNTPEIPRLGPFAFDVS